MTSPEILLKHCTGCGAKYPATSEYFFRQSTCRDGLTPRCKECIKRQNKEWKKEHPEKCREYSRGYKERNRGKEKQRGKERYWKNTAKAREYNRNYHREHREEILQRQKRNYWQNPDKARAYGRKWRADHIEQYRQRHREQQREYRRKYGFKVKQSKSAYQKRSKHIVNAAVSRREARKKSLPAAFTGKDWERCLAYWGNCCCVCGNQQGFWSPLCMDHWIPLTSPDCPGTIPKNIVVLCRECNSSKNNHPAEEWLIIKVGKHKAREILTRVEAYFEWVKNQTKDE